MYGALVMFEDEFIHIVAISFTSLVLTELIMVALTIRTWHYIMVLAELLSLGLYILSLIVLKDYFGESQIKYAIIIIHEFLDFLRATLQRCFFCFYGYLVTSWCFLWQMKVLVSK